MNFQGIFAFMIISMIQNTIAYAPWIYNGTTPGIKDIIEGRCWQYQILESSNRKDSTRVFLNCTEVWDLFHSSFANKDTCTTNVTREDYEKLFKKIHNPKKLTHKSIFWSGTRSVVHDFTYVNENYQSMEDTFPGYIANDLRWCGCNGCPDGISDLCNKTCPDPTKPFWDLSSQNFAEKADGIVYVMVNGTAKGINTAYFNGSIFSRVELPALGRMKQITLLSILVVFDLDETPKETCLDKSEKNTLLQLFEDATKYGIKYTCTDDPRMVNSVLCAKYPHAQQCQEKKIGNTSFTSEDWEEAAIALIVITCLCLVVIMRLVFIIVKRRGASKSYEKEMGISNSDFNA